MTVKYVYQVVHGHTGKVLTKRYRANNKGYKAPKKHARGPFFHAPEEVSE